MKIVILISEERPHFSDYHSEILGPKYVSFRSFEVKIGLIWTVGITPKVHTNFCETALYTFLWLVRKALETLLKVWSLLPANRIWSTSSGTKYPTSQNAKKIQI